MARLHRPIALREGPSIPKIVFRLTVIAALTLFVAAAVFGVIVVLST
jgi:hypothetical protein